MRAFVLFCASILESHALTDFKREAIILCGTHASIRSSTSLAPAVGKREYACGSTHDNFGLYQHLSFALGFQDNILLDRHAGIDCRTCVCAIMMDNEQTEGRATGRQSTSNEYSCVR